MAYLDQPINLNELPEDTGGDFSPVPPGDYAVTVKEAELLPNSDGTGQLIKMRLDITGPSHAGRVVFARINLRNTNPQAESIGRAQLGSLMRATGITNLVDTDQLIGANLMVKLSIKEANTNPKTGKHFEASNEVKAYKAAEGAMPTAAPMGMPKPAAAAPAKAAPPWAKK